MHYIYISPSLLFWNMLEFSIRIWPVFSPKSIKRLDNLQLLIFKFIHFLFFFKTHYWYTTVLHVVCLCLFKRFQWQVLLYIINQLRYFSFEIKRERKNTKYVWLVLVLQKVCILVHYYFDFIQGRKHCEKYLQVFEPCFIFKVINNKIPDPTNLKHIRSIFVN